MDVKRRRLEADLAGDAVVDAVLGLDSQRALRAAQQRHQVDRMAALCERAGATLVAVSEDPAEGRMPTAARRLAHLARGGERGPRGDRRAGRLARRHDPGEHGVGVLKRPALDGELGPARDLHRAVKRALDPADLLNPGRAI